MWGVGWSYEIQTIAEAETVLIVESSLKASDKARWPHSAGEYPPDFSPAWAPHLS